MTAGLVTAIIVIGLVVLFSLMGIGKKEETTVEFQCKPWQAPVGGDDCNKCGDDGLPCNKYKCESLGQTCDLINEDTVDQECIDINPNDASAPVINPNNEYLEDGFSYSDISGAGFNVLASSSDGCLPAFSQVVVGLTLDEPGQCKIDNEGGKQFDEMGDFFGASSLYKKNHSMSIVMPSLDLLIASGSDLNPDRRADFDMNIRCQD